MFLHEVHSGFAKAGSLVDRQPSISPPAALAVTSPAAVAVAAPGAVAVTPQAAVA